MTSRLDAVLVHAREPAVAARFWADLLEWDVHEGADVVRREGSGFKIRFVPTNEVRTGPNKVHLHLTSTSDDDQRRVIDRVLALGGSHLDVGQLPDEGHVVLADPDGNELCVIEPGSSFLAGCGFLGELACDGSREVGVFWGRALDWPLVWDEDDETAIQAPTGGTKVAWGGPPFMAAKDRGGLHFDLLVDGDLRSEVERLVSLGAQRVARGDEGRWTLLTDPDGNQFRVAPA